MVPDGWGLTRLSSLAKDQRNSFVIGPFGSDLVMSDYRPSGVPVVFVRDVKLGKLDWVSGTYVSYEKARELKAHSVTSGDIVVTKMGLPPGIAAIYPDFLEPGVITADIIRLKPDNSKTNNLFLGFLLNSQIVARQVKSITAGQTRPKLTLRDYKALKIPLPPLQEQQKIAQILSTWDKGIDTVERLIENSKKQKKALMQQLLTGKRRFPGFEDEWSKYALGQLTTIYDGTHQTPKYQPSGVPFYSVEHLTRRDFSETKFISEEVFEKEIKRARLERGDILMTRIGDIGTAVCINWDVRASFYVSLALIKFSKRFDSSYMNHYINSHDFQRELHKRTIHVAFPKKINLGEIGNCLIRLPCIGEQQRIAQTLSTCDREIENLEQQHNQLQTQKKALMQQLLTGKRRVKVDV